MKKIILAILAIFWALPLWAGTQITVQWDPNPPEEQVTGYTVVWGHTSAEGRQPPEFYYEHYAEVGPFAPGQDITTYTIELTDQEWSTGEYVFIAATAWRDEADGTRSESLFSDEISEVIPAPPLPPVTPVRGIRITTTTTTTTTTTVQGQ